MIALAVTEHFPTPPPQFGLTLLLNSNGASIALWLGSYCTLVNLKAQQKTI